MKSIIFRGDMVLAILAGKKTETRREHKKPRFEAGDVVYVKEAYVDHYFDEYEPTQTAYRANWDGKAADCVPEPKWKTPLFMPEWASRIKLRITEARQEPLHTMTDTDALAEGIEATPVQTPLEVFAALWDEIKGEGAWDKNPTVCVYRLERVS